MAVRTTADPLITQLRREITETDRAIVELVNKRLGLVATMKGYKARRGIEFVDVEREDWMLTYLQRANGGPLSPAGLKELFRELLALTKREVTRLERAEQ
jgi:chorismate mutase